MRNNNKYKHKYKCNAHLRKHSGSTLLPTSPSSYKISIVADFLGLFFVRFSFHAFLKAFCAAMPKGQRRGTGVRCACVKFYICPSGLEETGDKARARMWMCIRAQAAHAWVTR